jgi:hypothetical protein
MSFRVHDITQYNYAFDARTGSPGQLQLWGDQGKIAQVEFVDDASPVPPPVFPPDLSSAKIFFKRSALAGIVDMLRNEGPVRLTINDQPPGFVLLHTGPEPVGEGEK